MVVITAKFQVRPERADEWPEITADFTRACNAEPGCPRFGWSRSVEDPTSTSSPRRSATRRPADARAVRPLRDGAADTAAVARLDPGRRRHHRRGTGLIRLGEMAV